ncbi:MAG: SRPBCC domain-containing protein [Gemmatales bacterium]
MRTTYFMLLSIIPSMLITYFASGAETGTRQFEHTAVLPCSLAEAWHLWTTNEGFQKSVGVQGSDIELKIGGKYEIYFGMTLPVGQRGSEGSTVLSYHPMEMFAFSWNAPPSIPELRKAGAMTQVVLRFESTAPNQTKVTLTHLGIGTGKDWDKYQQYFKNAWPNVTKHMIDYLKNSDRPTKNIVNKAELNPLKHEGIIDAPVAEVWKAFTTKDGLESWMVAKASFDLKVGGKMQTTYNKEATLGDEHTIENTIRAYVPERMLSIQCTKTPKGFPFTELFTKTWSVCYFEPINDKQTRVRFVGMNYGTDDESKQLRRFFEVGNAQVMQSLKKRFEKK